MRTLLVSAVVVVALGFAGLAFACPYKHQSAKAPLDSVQTEDQQQSKRPQG